MEKILTAIQGSKAELGPDNWQDAAEAIMTTDTHPKCVRRQTGDAVIVGMAKGAGMIEPNLATMLSFWVTDAEISNEAFPFGTMQDIEIANGIWGRYEVWRDMTLKFDPRSMFGG